MDLVCVRSVMVNSEILDFGKWEWKPRLCEVSEMFRAWNFNRKICRVKKSIDCTKLETELLKRSGWNIIYNPCTGLMWLTVLNVVKL